MKKIISYIYKKCWDIIANPNPVTITGYFYYSATGYNHPVTGYYHLVTGYYHHATGYYHWYFIGFYHWYLT